MDNIACKTLPCPPSDCPGQGKWDVLFGDYMGSWHCPASCHPQSNQTLANHWLHSLSLWVSKCKMTPIEAIPDPVENLWDDHHDYLVILYKACTWNSILFPLLVLMSLSCQGSPVCFVCCFDLPPCCFPTLCHQQALQHVTFCDKICNETPPQTKPCRAAL